MQALSAMVFSARADDPLPLMLKAPKAAAPRVLGSELSISTPPPFSEPSDGLSPAKKMARLRLRLVWFLMHVWCMWHRFKKQKNLRVNLDMRQEEAARYAANKKRERLARELEYDGKGNATVRATGSVQKRTRLGASK